MLVQTLLFVLQLILSRINFGEGISPVGFPFAMVRVFYGHNIFLVTAEYLVSKIWIFFKFSNIFIVIFEVVIIGLYFFCLEYIKCHKKRLMLAIFVAISKALLLYYNFVSLEAILIFLLGFILEIIVAVYFYKFFEVYKNKFLFFKFSNLDYFLFAVMVLLISLGVFSCGLIEKHAGLLVLSAVLVVGIRILPIEKFYIVASMLSLGAVWVSGNYFYLIFMTISLVCLINFKDINKYWFAVFAAVEFALFVVIFKMYDIFSYFSFIFAVFLIVLIPQKFISKLSLMFEQEALQMILSEVQEERTKSIKNKLDLMSDTFVRMQQDFKMLIIGKINRASACSELVVDITNRCCKSCENYKFCFLQNLNKKQMIESLLGLAIENHGITLDGMGNGLQTYCMKKGILVAEINQMAENYLSYEKAMKSEDESKLLISSELGNFADIFSNFSKVVNSSAKINQKMSKILKENILNSLIDVKETLIFETEDGIDSVCVVSQNENLLKRELHKIIEKVTRNKMKLTSVRHLEISGLGIAMFSKVGRFRLDIAVSSKSKADKNGDNVVVTKLSETKYFIAIADGMGHGESANRISSMVLSLIRSMFEVGLDDELIIQSVNKLLLPAGLDNFTTLDACVIDLEKEVCNFVKLGSSVSVIKHKNTSEVISAQSLPIGVVQNIRPTIIKKHLCFDDVIFLASDGVVDAFSSVDEFKCFINDTKIYNLQKHLDNIIFDAEYQTKHLDDMTIIGINLLKN